MERTRREVLAAVVAAASVGCVDAAAPSGPRNPPSEGDARSADPTDPDDGPDAFRIGEWDVLEAADGDLLVTATIVNDAPSERSGTFVATVTLDEETHEGRTDVTVPPADATDVELVVDVPFERFDRAGSLYLDLVRTD
ncbi:hypothetical protein GRS48_06790 [Halorubrum sp. JWXQ-INN 858]|uniref:hypothetical protein n=1 Tax=Halorubrum sp. JWXQ-INN 858 TaxID=2690782 RepID=UPI00135C9576|nr:hypothetical protein [Halorubrum sp. JWXQ-INN 858]MWV64531.1 hypothetical protein [Halorubrum sp. JWXQ-INN 858]